MAGRSYFPLNGVTGPPSAAFIRLIIDESGSSMADPRHNPGDICRVEAGARFVLGIATLIGFNFFNVIWCQ